MPDSIALPCRPDMVQHARRAVAAFLTALEQPPPGHLIEDAGLIVSEFFTNSVLWSRSRHGGVVEVDVAVTEAGVHIEVVDDGPDAPETPDPDYAAEHGRGLLIVDSLADQWGQTGLVDGRALAWADLTEGVQA